MQHLYQHTAALLHVLEAKGRRMGTDEYLQVQELLRRLPPDTDPDTLLLVLAPLLARNPAEQEELYELFQTVKKEIAALQAPLPVQPPHPGARSWKWRIAIPALLLTALCTGLAWYYLTSPQQPVALLAFPARFGQTRTECPDMIPEIQQFGTIRATERLYPPSANTEFGVFFIDSAACITYTALDSSSMDSILVRLYGAGDKTILLLYKPYLEPPPALPAPVTPDKVDDDGITFEPKVDYPYEHDLLQFAVVDPPDWQQFFKNWWPILRWGALILFTLLLVAVWRYRAFKRRQLVAEQQSKDKPPYTWNVRLDGADELVSAEALRAAAQVLRRRAKGDTDDLDVPRSVQATAAAGGMPAFRFRRHTLPPEYLMLIDRQQGENHRARLCDLLYRGLRENEVEINRFFYDSEPRVLFNEEHPRGITLGELQQRHAQSRLILVGSGGQLLSPLDGRPASWTSQLSVWNHRLLLTPKAAAVWGRDERRLAEIFTLLPADIESLRLWLEEVEQGEDARFDDWHNRIPAAARAPLTLPENPALLPIYLEGQLGTDMLRWLAACAVYPSLHWDLTMWLNSIAIPSPKEDGSGISWPAAEALTRIPWFVSGRMPKEARSALLDWFEKTDPEGLSSTRATIAALLSQNPPPKDSAAWDQYRMHIALNQWLSTTDTAQKKQLEQEIALLLESGAEADFTVVKYLNAKRSPLEFPVPEAWRKFVYPGGYRALGWLRDWKDLRWLLPVWLAAAILCLWPWKMPGDACAADRVTWTPREGQAVEICLETPEAKLLYAEDQLLRSLENGEDTVLTSRKFLDFIGRQEKRLKYFIIQSGQKSVQIFLTDRSTDTATIISLATDLEKVVSSRGYGETIILYQSSDNDTSAVDFDDTPFLRTMEHRLSMETRFGIFPIDSFYFRLKEAHANIATAVYNLGVKHYGTYDAQAKTDAKEIPTIKNNPVRLERLAQLRDSACTCFTLAARLDSLDFDNRRAAAWCLGETVKPPEALPDYIVNSTTQVSGNISTLMEFEVRMLEATPLIGVRTNDGKWKISDGGSIEMAQYVEGYNNWEKKDYKTAFTKFYACIQGLKTKRDSLSTALIIRGVLEDAILRAGDCRFATRQYNEALTYYNESISMKGIGYQYAYLQKGMIKGLQGKFMDKVTVLEELVTKYPNSRFTDEAMFEIGGTYMQMLRLDQAVVPLNRIVADFRGKSNLVNPALLQLGLISYNQGKPTVALDYYKQVFSNNPENIEAKDALDAIQEIYERDLNRPDEYLAFLETIPRYNTPKPAMVFIPGGTFQMGDILSDSDMDSDELPTHTVTLGGYYLGPTEVTFDEYDLFCDATKRDKPDDRGWGRGRRPVIYVNWYDAIEYCNWLSEQHGYTQAYTIDKNRKDPNNQNTDDDKKWTVNLVPGANGYGLPTEAEWEYAARAGGKKVRFGNGKDIADPKEINFDASAEYKKDYSVVGEFQRETVPVGNLNSPNSLGLHDMSGNVWEWCWDWYDEKQYEKDVKGARNPVGTYSGQSRVLRGGSWVDGPNDCRASNRGRWYSYSWGSALGFRLVRH